MSRFHWLLHLHRGACKPDELLERDKIPFVGFGEAAVSQLLQDFSLHLEHDFHFLFLLLYKNRTWPLRAAWTPQVSCKAVKQGQVLGGVDEVGNEHHKIR